MSYFEGDINKPVVYVDTGKNSVSGFDLISRENVEYDRTEKHNEREF